MKFAKLTFLFAFAILTVLTLSFASATTIFSDGFESGTVGSAPNGWTVISGNGVATPWQVSSASPTTGSKHIEAKPGSNNNAIKTIIERTISTLGYNNIIVSYNKSLGGGWESGDEFNISWTIDDATFNLIETRNTQTSGYVSTTIQISSALANNNANFKIRIECVTSAADELCRLDDFRIEGTQIQSSSNLSISAPTTPISINQNATLIVSNNGNTNLQVTMSETSSPLFGVTFNPTSFSINSNGQQTVIAKPGLNNLKFGLNTVTVKADAGAQSATSNFQVKKTFCSSGEVSGNLTIENIDWSNNGEGEDNSWELLDEIEIEVEVGNLNDDDDVDAIVELGLFDSNGKNVADDLIFLADSDSDNEEIEINIDDDDEETVQWVFKVPADFDKGNYRLAIKVYDDDRGESRDCRDSSSDLSDNLFQTIDIEEASDEGRFVVVDDIELDSQVSCGQPLTGQFTVFNIGEDDQDRVRITIRNEELGVDLTREITSDLDRGDDETFSFTFQVPATAKNGNYVLEFFTEYDYRNGVYREESDDTFDAFFEVLGCRDDLSDGGGSLTNLEIDAILDSEAKPGEKLVVVATLKNTGTSDVTYSISARGYSTWANLEDISHSTVTVRAGDSEEVIFTLLVNKDASGTQSFDIQVSQDTRSQIQRVDVKLSSIDKKWFDSSNSLIWIIGAVNLILIILIIVVAVRLSRR